MYRYISAVNLDAAIRKAKRKYPHLVVEYGQITSRKSYIIAEKIYKIKLRKPMGR